LLKTGYMGCPKGGYYGPTFLAPPTSFDHHDGRVSCGKERVMDGVIIKNGMPLIWVLALVVAVVGFRVWAGIDTGVTAAYFRRFGKRNAVVLCTISVIGGALAIYVSRR